MKRFLAVIMSAAILLVSFTSCMTSNTNVDGEAERKQEAVKTPEKVKASSFEELLKKMTEAEKKIESLDADVKCIIDFQAMDEAERIETDVEVQADIKNMIYHTVTTILPASSGEAVTDEIYGNMNATYTKDYTDEWYKHSNDAEDVAETKELIKSLSDLEIDALKYVTDGVFEEIEYEGKECYKVSYNFNLRMLDILNEIGLENEVNELKTELSEEVGSELAAIILDTVSNLGSIFVVEYVDAYTLYPVAAEMDLTNLAQSLCDVIINAVVTSIGEGMTPEQLGINVAINELSVSMTADGFNNTSVVIPEDVLSASEFTDGYLDDYYEDDYYDSFDDLDDYADAA